MTPRHESIKETISGYLFKYLEQFRINLEKARVDFDEEAIHEFRVAVKRIRAIHSTVNRLLGEPVFPKGMIRPLRLMFKAGGPIRDDQVQIGLIENVEKQYQHPFPLIQAFYRKRIENQYDAFFLTSVDFDYTVLDNIREQIVADLEPLENEQLESKLMQYLLVAMDKLKKRRYDLEKPGKLHQFRTRYKEAGYVAEMLYMSKYTHKIPRATYNRMKNFGLKLGNWHDHYQLWSKTSLIFQESRDINLLEEAFELRKLITPIHDKLFQEMIHLIKRDDKLFEL